MTMALLEGIRFSVAGPGRVGESLARWAKAAGAELVSVGGRRASSASWRGAPRRESLRRLDTAEQDLLLVTVSDGAVAETAALLARRPQARVVLHTSGSLDASALDPLRQSGSAVGSLHPLKAFPRPLPDPAEAKGVFFAVDGDPEAQELAFRLAAAWGGVAAEVPPDARPLYHFAATLAAGGVTTLIAAAAEIAGRLGLPEEVARGYVELARGAVAAAGIALQEGRPLASAITGPAARGDRETLERHLEALSQMAPGKLPLAMFMALETLRQTGQVAETEAPQI
jgi:predicted short-subunit dehydrogenase-like oxidoreductase (DUF2520 family)